MLTRMEYITFWQILFSLLLTIIYVFIAYCIFQRNSKFLLVLFWKSSSHFLSDLWSTARRSSLSQFYTQHSLSLLQQKIFYSKCHAVVLVGGEIKNLSRGILKECFIKRRNVHQSFRVFVKIRKMCVRWHNLFRTLYSCICTLKLFWWRETLLFKLALKTKRFLLICLL